jgi:hypothetical protein
MSHLRSLPAFAFALPMLLVAQTAFAMFLRPNLAPVDRLLPGAQQAAEAHPSNAGAQYHLARIHYLAFVLRMPSIPVIPAGESGVQEPAPDHLVGLPVETAREQRALELAREELGMKPGERIAAGESSMQAYWQAVTAHRERLEAEQWRPEPLKPAQLVDHAAKAAMLFRKAMELDPRNPLFPLGLASLCEQFEEWRDPAETPVLPEPLNGNLPAISIESYFKAWSLADPTDSKAEMLPVQGLKGLISHEAGLAFLRLAEQHPELLGEGQRAEIPRVKSAVDRLEKLPIGAITPLVFSLEPHETLDSHLNPASAIAFDLEGHGITRHWQWLHPGLALLVWDPLDTRVITSGRQLFGPFTWELFWQDGFDALRALDTDGDGFLRGAELAGISAWFDLDGDGRSSASEVVPLHQLGVSALAVRSTAMDADHPVNRNGVTLSNGRTVPLWDWLARPASAISRGSTREIPSGYGETGIR